MARSRARPSEGAAKPPTRTRRARKPTKAESTPLAAPDTPATTDGMTPEMAWLSAMLSGVGLRSESPAQALDRLRQSVRDKLARSRKEFVAPLEADIARWNSDAAQALREGAIDTARLCADTAGDLGQVLANVHELLDAHDVKVLGKIEEEYQKHVAAREQAEAMGAHAPTEAPTLLPGPSEVAEMLAVGFKLSAAQRHHLVWYRWHTEHGLTSGEIRLRHRRETGKYVTVAAVKQALKRVKDSLSKPMRHS